MLRKEASDRRKAAARAEAAAKEEAAPDAAEAAPDASAARPVAPKGGFQQKVATGSLARAWFGPEAAQQATIKLLCHDPAMFWFRKEGPHPLAEKGGLPEVQR